MSMYEITLVLPDGVEIKLPNGHTWKKTREEYFTHIEHAPSKHIALLQAIGNLANELPFMVLAHEVGMDRKDWKDYE